MTDVKIDAEFMIRELATKIANLEIDLATQKSINLSLQQEILAKESEEKADGDEQ